MIETCYLCERQKLEGTHPTAREAVPLAEVAVAWSASEHATHESRDK